MKERPLLFSAPMVRAILSGTKTQTRRGIKDCWGVKNGVPWKSVSVGPATSGCADIACPQGKPGDRLWVREAWKAHTTFDHQPPRDIPQSHVWYLADAGYKAESRTRASMHMPRWASRITLEITAVRAERLLDISEADARAEGIAPFNDGHGWHSEEGRHYAGTAADAYLSLWATINGEASARENPWVWVIEFKKIST